MKREDATVLAAEIRGSADPDEVAANQWTDALPQYEEAIVAFENRRFKQACESFRKVVRLVPGDLASKLYVGISEDYADTAPPEGWDAVMNLTS